MSEKRLEDCFVIKNGRKLKFGYTTGSCAAAAAKAAALMLLGGEKVEQVELMTPKGIGLSLKILDIVKESDQVSCAVEKYAGDDPDVTDGVFVYAKVKKNKTGQIRIDGGEGVGRVTKSGLEQPVGAAAINRVPRQMVLEQVESVRDQFDLEDGLDVEISIPQGVELAKKTFNPRLGIEGGISVLGTSGIVVPMSEAALIKSIEIEMQMHRNKGEEYLLVTPGNYGEAYVKDHMQVDFNRNIKCSNYIGETIDLAINMGVKGILFVSHIGKFVKVAAGIMNTHSKSADARAEVLCAAALRAGADTKLAREILDTVTTDQALELLKKGNLLEPAMKVVMERIQYYLDARSYDRIQLGAVVFSNVFGYLGETAKAQELKEHL